MKQKLILGLSVLLLVAVIVLIVLDFFGETSSKAPNPDMYSIDKLKQIDSGQICYKEIRELKTTLENFAAITLDEELNAYVCSDREVQVYNKAWKMLFSFRVDSNLSAIALDPGKAIYLGLANHVEVFDMKGKRTAVWKPYLDESYFTSLARIGKDIYAADAQNSIILRYDETGRLINTIGKKDTTKGWNGFIIPSLYFDVAAGPYNELWAANTGMHQLVHFSPEGEALSSWGTASMSLEGFAGCCNPVHFAILQNGYFVTYEKGLDRIKLYDPVGKYVCAVTGPAVVNEKSLNTCTISAPIHDLAVDKDGNIYALDGQSMRVRVYARK